LLFIKRLHLLQFFHIFVFNIFEIFGLRRQGLKPFLCSIPDKSY
jgi:hypothetical protein